MLSIRIGAEQRQVMAAMLHKKTLKFSPGLCMKISVLVPEATAKLSLDPMEDHYHVRLGAKSGCPMSLGLLVRTQEHGDAETGKKYPRQHGDVCSARLDDDTGQEYLERHDLLPFLQQLMKSLIDKRPNDPFSFMVQHVEAEATRLEGA